MATKKKEKDEFEEVIEKLEIDDTEIEMDDTLDADYIDESVFGDLIPNMAINETQEEEANEECIIEDETLLDVYYEILANCRKDRENIDEVLTNFVDMVFNGGDATSATKEGVVNLMKAKSDISDKMTKVADLMTRIKLKSKDTFPRYSSNNQYNNVKINSSHRELLQKIEEKKRKKNDKTK
jgi:hypothetical protein